jgi:hypothetical protein
MHSNFITAPDYVENVLIVGATEEEIVACAEAVKATENTWNVYFYNPDKPNKDWLYHVAFRVDTVLTEETLLDIKLPNPIGFGPNCKFKSPADYFTK